MNELTIERMVELERMIRSNNVVYPLNLAEWRYIERAKKVSYSDAQEEMRYLGQCTLPLFEVKYVNFILRKYNCTFEELNKRFEEVYLVKKYEDSIANELLKEQKRMIKRMNRI